MYSEALWHVCDGGDWLDITAIFLPDGRGRWNPLTDDGDALRLAVALDLLFELKFSSMHSEELAAGADPYEATRRAIVRAAAAMMV